MSGWQFVLMNLRILARRKLGSCQNQLVIINKTGNFLICCKCRATREALRHNAMFVKKVLKEKYGLNAPIFKSDS